MFEDWKREWEIRRVLRRLGRQRVAVVAQPGSLWIIEKALQRNSDTEAMLATCLMRGWVEPLQEDLPTGS